MSESNRVAYQWVKQGVKILENEQQQDSESVKGEFQLLINSMSQHKEKAEELKEAIDHFLKVTASYGDGRCARL